MTDTTEHPVDVDADEHAEAHDDHHGPSDTDFIWIGLILAVITAVEVAFYYFADDLGSIEVPGLIVMMIVKFIIVAAWFMHLRFDKAVLTYLFAGGAILAFAVYIAMLYAFEFF